MQSSSSKQYEAQQQRDASRVPSASPSSYNDLMGQTFVALPRKRLFDGISVAQVIAASAAAATSMLLASKIGIAGSVIGAAVSSMVTVICSQLYRNALDASAEKLRLKQLRASDPAGSYGTSSDYRTNSSYVTGSDYATSDAYASPLDGQIPQIAEGVTLRPGARIAPTKLRARAAAERSANARKVAYASVGIALLAVALCAGAILLSTSGEGLGIKTPSIFGTAQPAPSDTTVAPDAQPDGPAAAPIAPSDSTTGTNSGTNSGTTDSGSTPGSGSDTSDTTTPDTGTENDTTTPDTDGDSSTTDSATGDTGTQPSSETGAKATA